MTRSRVLSLLVAATLILVATPIVAGSAANPQRYIVTFEGGAVNEAALAEIESLGAVKAKELPVTGAAVVYLPAKAADKAAEVPGVAVVEPDAVVRALAKPDRPPKEDKSTGKPQAAEVLPWGVDRVEADLVWSTTTGDPIKVAVIDTGIDQSHSDLVGNLKGGMSAVSYTSSYNDDNGHGSHVAGIVAAVDNEIGVIGTASSADLYAVKVLDRQGSGYLSDVIEGIDWATANGMDVINMSLGTPYYSYALDVSVQSALSSGVVVVAAAGNSGPGDNTVEYPGALSGVIAVGATDSSDAIAYFSSRGPQVDLAAPGVSIYSTYKRGGYETLSGTSMASPHVAGVAALLLDTAVGANDANGNGAWDPAEVHARLTQTAQDLGPSGFDSSYGYGLVRADLALAP